MIYYFQSAALFNTTQLQDELATAGLPVSTDIETMGSQIQLLYSPDLTNDQYTTLSTVVANHVPNPNYVTLAVQAAVAKLTSYLNSTDVNTQSIARATIVANIAPKLPLDTLTTINAQIAAKVGS